MQLSHTRPVRSATFDDPNLVSCAGLQADWVARACEVDPSARIVPFRGEYFSLAPRAAALVKGLIYPVPDPRFPFLGVHFTRGIDGSVHAGPNAVLALKREGYRWRDVGLRDSVDALTYPGFLRMASHNLETGVREVARSLSRSAFAASLAASFVAGAATGPFAMHHFNRMASWGLFANLAVAPLSSFVIMPFLALGAALEPLGDKGRMDLVFTVGQYTQVSMMLNSFGVQLEDESQLNPELDLR